MKPQNDKFSLIFEKLEKILIQTTKTNGRVNRLEKDTNKNEQDITKIYRHIYLAMWGLGVLSIFGEKILNSFLK